ncbi:MAG TPA: preprotein translocase subunit SecG [Gemmatimonadaceae bacterium]
MYTFLLVLLILDSLVLIAAILLQSGKGSGLSASFGGVSSSADSLLGTRQAGNLLTKASWWGGGLFLFLALVLSVASTQRRAPKSVLDQAFTQPTAPAAPATGAPPATSGAAGVPLTPAPSTAAPAVPGASQPAAPAPAAPATKKP